VGSDGQPRLNVDLGRLRLVDAGSSPIAVREWGDPAGRPLLFLHGLGPVNSSAFLSLASAPLVGAGFHLVGIDQPGFGASPACAGDAYDVSRLGDRVWDVADACDLQRPVIMGHSWGATIACQAVAARSDQVTALVLADAGHRDWADTEQDLMDTPLEEIVRGGEGVRLKAADRTAVAGTLEVPTNDALVDVVLAALVDDGSGGLISRATGAVLGNAQYHAVRARPSEAWPNIAADGIPTLLLLATVPEEARAGNQADSARFAAAVPQAEVVLVDRASHQMITDLRDGFGALVADWLGRTLP